MITLSISSITVAFMCPLMSLVASLLFNFTISAECLTNICVRNFPMALFWQIFYAGPFVRFIFRLIFKNNLKNE